jgi:hypothetical protein
MAQSVKIAAWAETKDAAQGVNGVTSGVRGGSYRTTYAPAAAIAGAAVQQGSNIFS